MSNKSEPCPTPPRGEIGPRINMASRLLRHRFNEVAQEEGLFAGQQHIILLLSANEGITVSEIARFLDITPATVSVSIKRMGKAGFVTRVSDESNARITRLYLTERGRQVPCRIRERMDAHERDIALGLTEEEIGLFSDMLDKVINNMRIKEEME